MDDDKNKIIKVDSRTLIPGVKNNSEANSLRSGLNKDENLEEFEEPCENIENEVIEEIPDYSMDYYMAFIGDKYNCFFENVINIWGMIFGGFYFLYRKMYLFGCIVLFLELLLGYFNVVFTILFNLVLLFLTNYIYKYFVKKKVLRYSKSNLEYDKVISWCRKNGGASFIGPMLGCGCFVGVIFLYNFLNLRFSVSDNLLKERNSTNLFNGEFKYISNLDYEKVLKVNDDYVYENKMYKYMVDDENVCDFTINGIKDYKDSSVLARDMALFYNARSNKLFCGDNVIDTVRYNKDIYYSFDVHDVVYLIKFRVLNDKYYEKCTYDIKSMFSNINMK